MAAVEPDVMDKKQKNEGIFAHGLGVRVILQGGMFALLTLSDLELVKMRPVLLKAVRQWHL